MTSLIVLVSDSDCLQFCPWYTDSNILNSVLDWVKNTVKVYCNVDRWTCKFVAFLCMN